MSPTAAQLEWQQDELAIFVHFGMNTFTDREWGDGRESPATFLPSALDMREVADAGRANGLKLGVYCSPWDRHEPSYGASERYNDLYCDQMDGDAADDVDHVDIDQSGWSNRLRLTGEPGGQHQPYDGKKHKGTGSPCSARGAALGE